MRRFATPLLFAVLVISATTSQAEEIILARLEADVPVRVVEAGTDDIVRAERIMVREMGELLTTIADVDPRSGEHTFHDLAILNHRQYVLSAWVDGVDYHIKMRGQQFLDGETAVIHAFQQTDSREGVAITGMNVIVRRRDTGHTMEYVLTLDNQSRPQRTVSADAPPVAIRLPNDLDQLAVEVDRGPEPVEAVITHQAGLHGIAFPLPPGKARVTITGRLPQNANRRFEVEANLPVEAWSLITWPDDLAVRCDDLVENREADYGGFGRWTGQPLAANQSVRIELPATETGTAQDVFTQPSGKPSTTRSSTQEPTRPPWLTIIAAAVLLAIYGAWRLRR